MCLMGSVIFAASGGAGVAKQQKRKGFEHLSIHEKKLKQKYENDGYKFLYDLVGNDSNILNVKVSRRFGVPLEKVRRVQGDCIDAVLGCSRWLMFVQGGLENAV
jgi:hypothetical protein